MIFQAFLILTVPDEYLLVHNVFDVKKLLYSSDFLFAIRSLYGLRSTVYRITLDMIDWIGHVK